MVGCMRWIALAALAGLVSMGPVDARAAVIADFVADFSPLSNPAGPWQYGSTATLGGPLTVFPNVFDASGGGDVRFDWNPGPRTPLVGVLIPGVGSPTGILHPGGGGVFAAARYVAPGAMTVWVDASFSLGDQTTTDVHVLWNGASLFDAPVDAGNPTQVFQTMIVMGAGDTLDFVAGWGANATLSFDTTFFTATLHDSPIPEPATAGLLLATLAGLGWARGPGRVSKPARGA